MIELSEDSEAHRYSETDMLRSADVDRLLPKTGRGSAIDIGARDGHFSRYLTEHFDSVVALDLIEPRLKHPRIRCVAGDVRELNFPDDSFDLVLCTEVLEHISPGLSKACVELERVSRKYVLVGVPYMQDTRVGRTTCSACGAVNPPWGHINRFDDGRLQSLFPTMIAERVSYVGSDKSSTNAVSTLLMDLAGNPYGTYGQDEPCHSCGTALMTAPPRTLLQKVLTKAAFLASRATEPLHAAHPSWVHCLFRKPNS